MAQPFSLISPLTVEMMISGVEMLELSWLLNCLLEIEKVSGCVFRLAAAVRRQLVDFVAHD